MSVGREYNDRQRLIRGGDSNVMVGEVPNTNLLHQKTTLN